MKKKALKNIPFLLLAATLFIMYGTNVGIPGITQYWNDFKLLDMQPFYSADTVTVMLQHIGVDGVRHYLYYLVVDFVFIIFLFFAQIRLSSIAYSGIPKIQKILFLLAAGRCVFDLLEDFLLALILSGILPIRITFAASMATQWKFLCLIVWGCLLTAKAFRKSK